MDIIINRTKELSEYKGTTLPTQTVWKEVRKGLKAGKLQKEIDTEETLAYSIRKKPLL